LGIRSLAASRFPYGSTGSNPVPRVLRGWQSGLMRRPANTPFSFLCEKRKSCTKKKRGCSCTKKKRGCSCAKKKRGCSCAKKEKKLKKRYQKRKEFWGCAKENLEKLCQRKFWECCLRRKRIWESCVKKKSCLNL